MRMTSSTRTPATQCDDQQGLKCLLGSTAPGSRRRLAWHRASEPANGRPAKPAKRAESGANEEVNAQVEVAARNVRGLLIRGFGVQVPGSAPVLEAQVRGPDLGFRSLLTISRGRCQWAATYANNYANGATVLSHEDIPGSHPQARRNLRDLSPPGRDPITKRYQYACDFAASPDEAEARKADLIEAIAQGRQPPGQGHGQRPDRPMAGSRRARAQHPGRLRGLH
jgi:hypothetical protein